MKPGEIYKIRIDKWNTSNVFLAGHKLRLEISTSNFPCFDRNLNTGENAGVSRSMVKAENAIYHDARYPSALNWCPNGACHRPRAALSCQSGTCVL